MRGSAKSLLVLLLFIFSEGCDDMENNEKQGLYKKHTVSRATQRPELAGNWDGKVWSDVKAIELKEYMGEYPEHFPKTQAKLLYDDEFVYVIFRVEDRYVRAVAKSTNDNVFHDSCVEFFFTPGEDLSEGYFNIEVNCGGTMLFHHQITQGNDVADIVDSDRGNVKIYHSQPRIVEPEITEPVTWVVEYCVPLDLLEKYATVQRPGPGVTCRANLYKIASRTSHRHYLTWSLIDYPKPKFHLPQFFGTLEFK